MLDTQTLLLAADQRRLYFLTPVSVSTHMGDGVAVYVNQDGYVGVRLNGETRIEEVGKEHVSAVPAFAYDPSAQFAEND